MSAKKTKTVQEREFFNQERDVLPLPDLSRIQKDSYARFLEQGIQEVLDEVNPIEDYTGNRWELSFSKPVIKKEKCSEEEAIRKGLTYSAPWYVDATLTAKDPKAVPGKASVTDNVYMGEIPLMTDRGTFIINNGVERVIINQLLRSEGVYFSGEIEPASGWRLSTAKVLPKSGAWLEISTSKNNVITVRINRYRKVAATALLRLFGFSSDEEIMKAFEAVNTNPDRDYIKATLEKDASSNYDEAVIELFKKIRPGEPLVLDNAKAVVEDMFFNDRRYNLGEVGRFKMGLLFDGEESDEGTLLTKEDLVNVFTRLIELNNGVGAYTDIDNLSNRRVKTVGELVQHQMRVGFLQTEKHVKERMSLQSGEEGVPSPSLLISPRPVEARVHSFFASNQLSQYHDETNLLAGLDHLRRLSVAGPGGLSEERASFSVRDAHYSHYGRICPIRTPEGPKIGLVTYLALYARVNEHGFLETPYRKLKVEKSGKVKVTDTIEYLPAYEEEKYSITDSSVRVDDKGYVLDKLVPLRRKSEFYIGQIEEAAYMDLVPRQVVGISASLVPFVAHDDPPRALMASNMQTQAVPLLKTDAPLVGTGMEKDIARNTGAALYAEEAGTVTAVDADHVVVTGSSGKKYTYRLTKFTRTNNDTEFTQHPAVSLKQKVKKGDLLVDGPSIDHGEMALGANLLTAYMAWYGYGYEDAIILSERLVKDDTLSSVHISEHTVQVMETKLGPEEVTRDIPNVSEDSLRSLDEAGVVYLGAKVKSGDILVGKIAPKGETELTAEERLLRAIFGEKAREVRDNSLKMPHGDSGTVIGVKEITKDDNEELQAGVLKEITVRVAQVRKIMVGDKLAGRHGNKGVISKIVPVEDMPHLEDGTPVDIIIPAVNVIGRMNVGQLLETHLGWAAKKLGKTYAVPVFEEFNEDFLVQELKDAGTPCKRQGTSY